MDNTPIEVDRDLLRAIVEHLRAQQAALAALTQRIAAVEKVAKRAERMAANACEELEHVDWDW